MSLKTPHELVMEWHKTYGIPVGNPEDPWFPQYSTSDRTNFRMNLIREEVKELEDAVKAANFIETLDALGDIVYVVYGFAIEMGVNLDWILDHIQKSNMSKLGEDGKPIYRQDGKVLKGPNFKEPDIEGALYTMEDHFYEA